MYGLTTTLSCRGKSCCSFALQQRREQTGGGVPHALREVGLHAVSQRAEWGRLLLVGEEYRAHPLGEVGVVEEGVALEVVLERAEVAVRGAAGGYLVVADHEL